jgi:hypothetical protein
MKEAIAKINEIAGVLQQSIARHEKAVKEINERAFKLAESERAVEARELDISKRENKIKAIENVVAFKDEAIALKDEANQLYAKYQDEKKAFMIWSISTRDQIIATKRDIEIAKAKADKENVMIQKEWEALNKEKAEYKNNILNELKSKIG